MPEKFEDLELLPKDKWDIRVHPDGKFLIVGAWVGKDKHRRYYTCPGGGYA